MRRRKSPSVKYSMWAFAMIFITDSNPAGVSFLARRREGKVWSRQHKRCRLSHHASCYCQEGWRWMKATWCAVHSSTNSVIDRGSENPSSSRHSVISIATRDKLAITFLSVSRSPIPLPCRSDSTLYNTFREQKKVHNKLWIVVWIFY
jgi:hypothetical protein